MKLVKRRGTMEKQDFEKVIMQKAAADFISNLPPETKEKLMSSAMETVLAKLISSYSVEQAIQDRMKDDVLGYVEEYLADPTVQQHLMNIAHDRVEELFSAVISSIGVDLRKNMKSKYCNFDEGQHDG